MSQHASERALVSACPDTRCTRSTACSSAFCHVHGTATPKTGGLPTCYAMDNHTHDSGKIIHLPDAGREEQLEHWDLNSSHRWDGVKRWGHGPENDGPLRGGRHRSDYSQGTTEISSVERDFLAQDCWGVAWVGSEHFNGGLVAHRGVLQDGEYVDEKLLLRRTEVRFGYTADQVRSVFRQGPLSADQRELRNRIDARLLLLRNAGANMAMLGRVLGLEIKPNGSCHAIDGALKRARAEAA